MEKKILIKAGIKKHKGSLIGIALLLFLVAVSLFTVLTLILSGGRYVHKEMQESGYGTLTAWVSDVPDIDLLVTEIQSTEGVSSVWKQELIYSDYESATAESDSEGQLVPWDDGYTEYRFFKDDLSGYQEKPEQIQEDEIYVPATMTSILNIQVGDRITFKIARGHMTKEFTVAGFFEDPVMGSSMIGMKTFLISRTVYEQILQMVQEEGVNALARAGAAIHITRDQTSELTAMELNEMINENTSVSQYTEDVYSADTMESFMLILQNAFGGILAAFAILLLAVVVIMLQYSISGMIEEDWKNLGILKTIGMDARRIIWIQVIQYAISMFVGLGAGWLLAVPLNNMIRRELVLSSGFLIPAGLPVIPCLIVTIVLFVLLNGMILFMLRRIGKICPMDAIRDDITLKTENHTHSFLAKKGLPFWIALRQTIFEKRRYIGACMVAILLTFFVSLAGRVNVWLGADGKGMMDAFNPADHDIGIQVFGNLSLEEMENEIRNYSEITESYMLAMQDVSVNGRNYTANVITEPDRFHISQGKTSSSAETVVITETIAKDLGIGIGDTVHIRGDKATEDYVVSGIYHCANDMGENIGMSMEGYFRIGQDDAKIWCHHYFLSDTSQKEVIMENLQTKYGGDVHVHENTWTGLASIIQAMHYLILVMYIISFAFIGIVTFMTGSRIMYREQKNMGICKVIGFSVQVLRISFALRFGIVAVIGAVLGTIVASAFTDPIVGTIMRFAGISNFSSGNTITNTILPVSFIVIVFVGFAYMVSYRIRKNDMSILTQE